MPGLTIPSPPSSAHEPDITLARLGFLADLPRYKSEKPCLVVPPAKPTTVAGVNPPNVKMDYRDGVMVENVRAWKDDLRIDEHGFQVLEHRSEFGALDTKEVCDAYKKENQAALVVALGAEKVVTWGLKACPTRRSETGVWG